jgi:hypothetical protein
MAGPASATPTYGLNGSFSYNIVQNTPIDVAEQASTTCGSSCTYIDMYAGPGVLENGIDNYVESNPNERIFNVYFEITDLVFSDTTESGATTTSVAAVVDYSWLSGFNFVDTSPGIDLTVSADYQAGGTGAPIPSTTPGQSGQIVFPTWNNVALDVAYTFGINLHWETNTPGNGDGLLRAQLADIPFILDEGITANSVEMNVTDNTFAAVPEPSTALLIGGGLCVLAAGRRRRT